MSRVIMLIPIEPKVGLTSIKLGMIYAIEHAGIHLNTFNPICQVQEVNDSKNQMAHNGSVSSINTNSLEIDYVRFLLAENQKDILLEKIITNYYQVKNKNTEIMLVEGLISTNECQFAQSLNYEIAKSLNAEIIFIMSHNNSNVEQLKKRIKSIYISYNNLKNISVAGIIINKLNAPISRYEYIFSNLSEIFSTSLEAEKIGKDVLQKSCLLPIIGMIPWNRNLITVRAVDIVNHLSASIINKGDLDTSNLTSIVICIHNIQYLLKYFSEGSLLIVSSDRYDVLVAACLTVISGIKIGAILLTDSYKLDVNINTLCKYAFNAGLPVFTVNTNIWQTIIKLCNFDLKIIMNNTEHINKVQRYVAQHINIDWMKSLTSISKRRYIFSPPVFRYKLTELARKANKRIILPEGNEPRIIKAAAICAEKNIATCVLLGNPDKIKYIAVSQNIKLSNNIEIIDPDTIRKNYITRLFDLRKNKGMTESIAHEQLKNNIILGTMMLEKDEVDGLVSGVIHTTANTIRPSLQLIKTAPGNSLVSSIFFMLLPEQVYIYGDCAINTNPTAEQLSEIAIQSANSAITFGIEPRVAMLSYSTGTSGSGSDVEKVCKATYLAQKKCPHLIIDGPLQYDAAVTEDVAKSKAPNSPVAGHATVFIFPDLNAGNITYKAIQRTANLVSIGPILQGMRKPVNDLSRGALVDDIVYTIAITAVQATWK